MNQPIPPLPEQELCEYEKLREKNIKERENAMADCKFFENLQQYKKEIGLEKKIDKKKDINLNLTTNEKSEGGKKE